MHTVSTTTDCYSTASGRYPFAAGTMRLGANVDFFRPPSAAMWRHPRCYPPTLAPDFPKEIVLLPISLPFSRRDSASSPLSPILLKEITLLYGFHTLFNERSDTFIDTRFILCADNSTKSKLYRSNQVSEYIFIQRILLMSL